MSINSPSGSEQPQNGPSKKAKTALLALGVVAAGLVARRVYQQNDDFVLYGKEGCSSKIVVHPENVKIKECNHDTETAEVIGPTAIMFKGQIIQVLKGKADLTLHLKKVEEDGSNFHPGSIRVNGKALISVQPQKTRDEMIESIKTIQRGQWIGNKEELDQLNKMWDENNGAISL